LVTAYLAAEVVALRAHDARARELPDFQLLADFFGRQQSHDPVDLRRVGIAATHAAFSSQGRRRVDQHLHGGADAPLQLGN